MTQTGQQQLETLQQDLACPNCNYNLRGLTGQIINCPECGQQCDIQKLLSINWEGSWLSVPGFATVTLPAIPGFIMILVLGVSLAAGIGIHDNKATILTVLVGLVFWIPLTWRTWKVLGIYQGTKAALLMHFVLIGYCFGIFGLFSSCLYTIISLLELHLTNLIFSVLIFLFSLGLLLAAHRVEKWVTRQCIRQYMNNIIKS